MKRGDGITVARKVTRMTADEIREYLKTVTDPDDRMRMQARVEFNFGKWRGELTLDDFKISKVAR